MMHNFRGNGVHVKNHAAVPGLTMNVRFARLGERGLHAVVAAGAGAQPTDWTLYDPCDTERDLGLDPEVYARNRIIADAPRLSRPLMLSHAFADDNVPNAPSLRLSPALMEAGRAPTVPPLTGITHMTNDPAVARNLLVLQRDFHGRPLGR